MGFGLDGRVVSTTTVTICMKATSEDERGRGREGGTFAMSVTVREATWADAEAVSGLVWPRLESWLDVPHRRLLVADHAGDVVGCLALVMTPRLESEWWWAQVVALVVVERVSVSTPAGPTRTVRNGPTGA